MYGLMNYRLKYSVADYEYSKRFGGKEHFKSYALFIFVLEKLAFRAFVF